MCVTVVTVCVDVLGLAVFVVVASLLGLFTVLVPGCFDVAVLVETVKVVVSGNGVTVSVSEIMLGVLAESSLSS